MSKIPPDFLTTFINQTVHISSFQFGWFSRLVMLSFALLHRMAHILTLPTPLPTLQWDVDLRLFSQLWSWQYILLPISLYNWKLTCWTCKVRNPISDQKIEQIPHSLVGLKLMTVITFRVSPRQVNHGKEWKQMQSFSCRIQSKIHI